MREVELTIQVLEDINDVIKKVESQGFMFVEKYYMKDYYMIHKSLDLNINNYDVLKKCLLLRNIIDANPKNFLVYKNKSYDENSIIISQNKIKTNIDSIDAVKKMLEIVDYTLLFEIENNSLVYKKDNTEIVIQNITNPKGIFIEIEATEDELLEKNDEKVKITLKDKLDKLQLKTTGYYEVKKAFIALDNIKKNKEI